MMMRNYYRVTALLMFVIFMAYVVSGVFMVLTIGLLYIFGFFENGGGVVFMIIKFSLMFFFLLILTFWLVKKKCVVKSRIVSSLVLAVFVISVFRDVYVSGLSWSLIYSSSWAGVFVLLIVVKILSVIWVSMNYSVLAVRLFDALIKGVSFFRRG